MRLSPGVALLAPRMNCIVLRAVKSVAASGRVTSPTTICGEPLSPSDSHAATQSSSPGAASSENDSTEVQSLTASRPTSRSPSPFGPPR